MIAKIQAKFRRRDGVPFAIEQLSGRQYRCRHCNTVYRTEKEINRHLKTVAVSSKGKKITIDAKTPSINRNTDINVLYSYDINDMMRRKYLKLSKDEVYDGTLLGENIINKKITSQ